MEKRVVISSSETGNAVAYTAEDLSLAQITNILKRPVVSPVCRLFLLSANEFLRREIPGGDIISIDYNENYNNGNRRTLSVKLHSRNNEYAPNINGIWGDSRFKFDVGITYKNKKIWFPKGFFILSDISENTAENTVTLSLQDKFSLFQNASGTMQDIVKIPAGSMAYNAVRSLISDNYGNGLSYDSSRLIFSNDLKNVKIPYDIIKNEGGAYAELLLDIANMLSADCFYNAEGNLCYFRANENLDDLKSPVLRHYKLSDFFDISVQNNFENVINRVAVISNNTHVPPCFAVSEIDSPGHPYSVKRIGNRTLTVQDDVIYSHSLAKQRANYELRKAAIKNTAVSGKVMFDPLIVCGNLIEADESSGRGIRYFVQSLSYSFPGAETSINFSNIDELPSQTRSF